MKLQENKLKQSDKIKTNDIALFDVWDKEQGIVHVVDSKDILNLG